MFNPLRKDDWKQLGQRYWWQLLLAQAVILFAAGAIVGWSWYSAKPNDSVANGEAASDSDTRQHGASQAARDDAEPQWWTCAMHPQIRQPKPGKCPICRMDLVPIAPSAGGLRTLTIKPAVKQLMKIETRPVERKYVTASIRMVGKVDFDETRLAHITAWVSGRLDRLYVDYTGIRVNPGDHLVYIYSEQLYAIQEELIQGIRFERENPRQRAGGLDLVEAAREKLRLLGLTDSQIAEIETREKAEDHITIYSPIGGIVIEKLRQVGDRVQTGDRIYTIADLNQVWVKLDAYESDLQWLRFGQSVSFTTEAYPGEKFQGRIAFIDPILNQDTRTVKVRVNVPNQDGRLKPEMFVRAVVDSNVAAGGRVLDADLAGKWISPMHPEIVKDEPGTCDICGMPLVRAESLGYVAAEADPLAKPLVIPVSAALVTGTRAIVYVEVSGASQPTYEGREILLGPRAGDYYLVRNGLFEGEMVVTNGNFKIDSALQIQAKPTMMTPEGGGAGGHDHGGTSGQPDESMTIDVPEGFAIQIHDLISQSRQVTESLKENQLETITLAFAQFSQALNRVNAEGLPDHTAMLWREFLMLLGNDAVEGSQASDLPTATRAAQSLSKNIRRMSDQFMLTHGDLQDSARMSLPKLTISEPFQRQLAELFKTYGQLQTALAADDVNGAAQAILLIQTAASAIDDQSLNETTREVWSKEGQSLNQIVTRLSAAQDIAAARAEFALLSEQLLAMVVRFGITGDGQIFELHCPMAFDGRGATWLQDNDQPKNPYFGASMLTCADRVRKIADANDADAEQGGHQHE